MTMQMWEMTMQPNNQPQQQETQPWCNRRNDNATVVNVNTMTTNHNHKNSMTATTIMQPWETKAQLQETMMQPCQPNTNARHNDYNHNATAGNDNVTTEMMMQLQQPTTTARHKWPQPQCICRKMTAQLWEMTTQLQQPITTTKMQWPQQPWHNHGKQ